MWTAIPGDATLSNQANLSAITVSPNTTTNFIVTATDSLGCTNTSSSMVLLNPYPVADFFASPKVVNILEPYVSFFDNSNGAVSWAWNLGDGTYGNTPSLNHVYGDTGTFEVTLIVKNQYGCDDSITNYVIVHPNLTFYVPSSFTPNGDLKNDLFHAYGEGVVEYELSIYNRWGELVFLSKDINISWDGNINGNEAPVGVYFYKINYTNGSNKQKIISGSVTLLR